MLEKVIRNMIKLLLLLFLLLASCGEEVQNCERVRVTPPVGNPYWVTLCTDGDGVVTIQGPITEEVK